MGMILPALRYHYLVFKHINVPKTYVVPDDDPTILPVAIRGFKLGKRVDNIRTRGDFVRGRPDYLELLRNAGGEEASGKFSWRSSDFVFEHQILPCLRYFKRKHGHLLVPRDFVMPTEEEAEAEEAAAAATADETLHLAPFHRGFPLGEAVNNIRSQNKGSYLDQEPERLQALMDMNFPWELKFMHVWDAKHMPVFMWFKKKHGHLAIPYDYECPSGEEALESGLLPNAHGLNLGRLARRIRAAKQRGVTNKGSYGDPARTAQLESIGFVYDVPNFFFRRTLLPTVTFFVAKYGHLTPPKDYVVPWGIKDVPYDAWGMNLHRVLISGVTTNEPGPKWLHWTCGSHDVRKERVEAGKNRSVYSSLYYYSHVRGQ